MIMKQGVIKHSLEDAKAVLKQMLSTLVDRLGVMSDATGGYHKKIESYMEEINSTENFTKLSHVVKGLLSDARGMSTDILRAREELVDTRQRVRAQDSKIHELETELVRVSELVRTDPLTAALNRRGFEEAYTVELARAERSATKLCVALIDLDDFKRLNDANGHQAGDDALVHLVAVIKEMTRPTDAVGRYGGEEFVILFPDTELAGAAHVTTRIQRSLTKRFFLHNNERLFISFSAGVAEVDHNLGLAEALERADKAVYEAKAAGKNRVITT
jgi:diguanylate cyclase